MPGKNFFSPSLLPNPAIGEPLAGVPSQANLIQQVLGAQTQNIYFNGMALNMASGTIAQAAIAAMNVTPVTLVNAPGAGRVLIPTALMVMCSIPTGSNWVGAPSIQIKHASAGIQLQTGTTGTNFNAAGPRNTFVYNNTWSYDSLSDAANQALQMNLSGAATPGGAGVGQFQWWLWFLVVDGVARLA